jgi:hypothetical protein
MKFNDQSLFSYAGPPFFGVTMTQIFSQIGIQPDQFRLTGLQDLKSYLEICQEWAAKSLPKLMLKELVKPGDATQQAPFDRLYQQYTNGSLSYSRDFNLPIKIIEEATVYAKTKEGPQRVVTCQFYVGIMDLYLADYFPSSGDLLFWRNITYQIRDARCAPSDYFQNTAFPLWLFLDAVPARQYGDTPATPGRYMPDYTPAGQAPGQSGGGGPVPLINTGVGGDNFLPPAPDIGALVGSKL